MTPRDPEAQPTVTQAAPADAPDPARRAPYPPAAPVTSRAWRGAAHAVPPILVVLSALVILGSVLAIALFAPRSRSSPPPTPTVDASAATQEAATFAALALQTAPPSVAPDTATPASTDTTVLTDAPASTNTPVSVPAQANAGGVSVCTADDFSRFKDLCTRPDASISPDQYDAARLVVAGPNGGRFQNDGLQFLLDQQNDDGSFTRLGSAADSVPVADTSESHMLSWLFDATGNTPAFDGTRYEVEVDSGDQKSLGVVDFALAATTGVTVPTGTPAGPLPAPTSSPGAGNESGPVRSDGTVAPLPATETPAVSTEQDTATSVPIAMASDTPEDTLTDVPTDTEMPTDVPTETPTPPDTDTPTEIPTETPIPTAFVPNLTVAGNACAGARTAANTVVRFYLAVDERRYADAYQCLSPERQAAQSLDDWIHGYDTTVASPLVVADQLDATTVDDVLDAVDRKNGVLIATRFTFQWQLDANGLLYHAKETGQTSGQVDDIPATDPAEIIAADGQQIVSSQDAYLTGGGVPDHIYITDNGGGRQVWIYEGNHLIFAETLSDIQDVQPAASSDGFTIDWSGGSETWRWTPEGFA